MKRHTQIGHTQIAQVSSAQVNTAPPPPPPPPSKPRGGAPTPPVNPPPPPPLSGYESTGRALTPCRADSRSTPSPRTASRLALLLGALALFAVGPLQAQAPPVPTNILLTTGNAQFTVNWDASPGAGTYVIRYGDPTSESDNRLSAGAFVRPGTVTSRTITTNSSLTITNGTTYRVRMRACAGQATSGTGCSAFSAVQTVVPTATPQLSFATNTYSVNEGESITMTVRISPRLTSASSVHVVVFPSSSIEYTVSGLSEAGNLYRLVLPANADSATFTFTGVTDQTIEGDLLHEFKLSVQGISNPPYGIAANAQITRVTIVDTTVRKVRFAETAYSVVEGDSITLTVTIVPQLTTASSVNVNASLPFSAENPEDFTLTGLTGSGGARQLTLPANTSTATFTFTAVADGLAEGDEVASWELAKSSDNEPYTVLGPSLRTTVTIATPQVSFAEAVYSVHEGNSITLTVNIAPQLASASSVQVLYLAASSADGSNDLTLSRVTGSGGLWDLTLPANADTATFTLAAEANSPTEGNETAIFQLSPINSSAPYAIASTGGRTTVTITDTSQVRFAAAEYSVAEGAEVTLTVGIAPQLTTASSVRLTYGASSSADSADDFTLNGVSGNTGSWELALPANADSATFTFAATTDPTPEGDEIAMFNLVAIASPPYSVAVDAGETRVTIGNEITPGLTLTATPNPVRQGQPVTITAHLSQALNSRVTIPITLTAGTANSADYGPLTGIDIAPGDNTGTGTIPTTAETNSDTGPGGGTFTVALGTPLPVGILVGQPSEVVVTIALPAPAELVHRAALPEVARAVADRVTGAISARVGRVLNGGGGVGAASLGGQGTLAGALVSHAPDLLNDRRPLRDLLDGSQFVLPLNGDGGGGGLRSASLWGSGDYRTLSGEDGGLDFDGNLLGAQLGADAKLRDDLLAGVVLSWSQGEFDYEEGGSGGSSGGKGDYEVDVISLHPYLGGRTDQLDWWATTGYGSGEVSVNPARGESASNDVILWTLGAGGSGQLWSSDTTDVLFKGEITQTEMDLKAGAGVASLRVNATLIRIAAQANRRPRTLSNGGQLSPSLSLGTRHDGGDGNTGSGAEVSGRVRYDNPQTGLSASASLHTLLGRSDYSEWGIQGMVRLKHGADGQGLSFILRPGYGGAGAGDTGQIWSHGLRDNATPTTRDTGGRLEMRLGYGLSPSGERGGLLTPWGGLTLHGDDKHYRLGLDWASGGPFTVRLSGERRERENTDADHLFLLKGEMRF